MARAAENGTDPAKEQWALVDPFTHAEYSGIGSNYRVNWWATLNAVLHQNRISCQWRLLPQEFPSDTS